MPMRRIALAASAVAFAIAALILWLGTMSSRDIERLIAEGAVTQGTLTGIRSGDSDEMTIAYQVGGRAYSLLAFTTRSGRSKPLYDPAPVDVPRFGPIEPFQIVYLPSDPEIARLRDDLNPDNLPVYATSAMFALLGLVFGFAGFVLLRPRGT